MPKYLSAHPMRAVPKELRRGHQTLCSWNYRWLLAAMWVLGTKCRSFLKAASAPKHWASLQPFTLCASSNPHSSLTNLSIWLYLAIPRSLIHFGAHWALAVIINAFAIFHLGYNLLSSLGVSFCCVLWIPLGNNFFVLWCWTFCWLSLECPVWSGSGVPIEGAWTDISRRLRNVNIFGILCVSTFILWPGLCVLSEFEFPTHCKQKLWLSLL